MPIKIEMPKKEIKFDIGGQIYTLSLSDKSRLRIEQEYQRTTKYETKIQRETTALINTYISKINEVEDRYTNDKRRADAIAAKKESQKTKADHDFAPMPLAKLNEERAIIETKYQKLIDDANKRLESHTEKTGVKFIDYLFGDGKGDEIFEMVDHSSLVLSKIIFQIMAEFHSETNIVDYKQKYIEKLAKLQQPQADK